MKTIHYIAPVIVSSLFLVSACVPKSQLEATQKQLAECSAQNASLSQTLDQTKKQHEAEVAALTASQGELVQKHQAEVAELNAAREADRAREEAELKAITSIFVRGIEAQDDLSVRFLTIAKTEITVVMAIRPVERQVDTTIGGTPMFRMQTVPFPRYLRAEFRSADGSREVAPSLSPQIDSEGKGIYRISLSPSLSEGCLLVLRREAG